jgi:hypothetical protein
MATREIVREEWPALFERFTRQHRGWLCTLEVIGPAIGAQVEARDLPFASISADAGSGAPPLRIALGDFGAAHVSHAVDAPSHVYLKQTDEGADEVLEIESEGLKTLLTFRVAASPETVDGVA